MTDSWQSRNSSFSRHAQSTCGMSYVAAALTTIPRLCELVDLDRKWLSRPARGTRADYMESIAMKHADSLQTKGSKLGETRLVGRLSTRDDRFFFFFFLHLRTRTHNSCGISRVIYVFFFLLFSIFCCLLSRASQRVHGNNGA